MLHCSASSKLAVSTAIQNIFRAEFASELRLQGPFHSQCRLFLPHRQTKRHFTHLRTLRLPQSERPAIAEKEPSAVPDAPKSSSKPRTRNRKDHGPGDAAASSSRTTKKGNQKERKKPESFRNKEHKQGDRTFEDLVASKDNRKKPEQWQIQKSALEKKFKEGWNPSKKLSPDAIEGIRHLHAASPDQFTTPVLAEQFKVSPEAIRRILKSKWRPSEDEMEDRRKRWGKRHDKIWSHMAELGLRPSTKRTRPLSDANVLYDDKPGM